MVDTYTDFNPISLRQLRQARGLPLAKIARICGVSRQAVHNWETGKVLPSRRSVKKLLAALQIEPANLTKPTHSHYNKIAISGSHGVGKTTLATQLAKELNYPLLTETAREVISKYVSMCSVIVAHPDKAKIQGEIFSKQVEKEAKHKQFISDRSVLDVLAYCWLYRMWENDNQHRLAKEIVLSYCNNYDLIIFCPIPPDSEIEDDGFRLTDKISQMDIDNYIRCLLNAVPTEVLVLPEDRSKWFKTALDHITSKQMGGGNDGNN